MTFKHALLGAAVASLALAGAAHAADHAAVLQPIPYGRYLASALVASTGLLTTVASALVVKYVPAAYRIILTPTVVADAVHFAVATTAGAVKDQAISVHTTNELIAAAEQYIVKNEPAVAKWLGEALLPRIVSMLEQHGLVPANAEVEPAARRLTLRASV